MCAPFPTRTPAHPELVLLSHAHAQTANTTAVSIALPTIGEDLNISESKLQWILSAFSLSSVSARALSASR